jgi:hypothetical protein
MCAFACVAKCSTLYSHILKGDGIALSNYSPGINVADSSISNLSPLSMGMDWVSSAVLLAVQTGSPLVVGQGPWPCLPAPESASKKQRATSPDQCTSSEPHFTPEQRKELGMFVCDPVTAGSPHLPMCPVFHKVCSTKNPECLCMILDSAKIARPLIYQQCLPCCWTSCTFELCLSHECAVCAPQF